MSAATVVLVHGAWHGTWCWEKVVPLLEARGMRALPVQLPLTSFKADVETVRAALDGLDSAGGVHSSVTLCAHSYGGAVATEAGSHARVTHLVYLCAVAPAEGEGTMPAAEVVAAEPAPTVDPLVINADGSASVDPELAPEMFYADCTPEDTTAALARLRPIQLACFAGTISRAAWRDRPSTYVLASEDRALPVRAQRHFAARCTDHVTWPTSHSPFLSRPGLVAELLTEIAHR